MSTFVLYQQWKRGDLFPCKCGRPGAPIYGSLGCRLKMAAEREKKRREAKKLRESQ